jgi:ketosteroid isomerase-like protein
MADEHPNVRLVKEGFEAFERGDGSWMDEHMADDVVWHVGGKSRMAGAYKGKEAALGLFAKQARIFSAAPQIDIHDVLGNDQHVIAIGKASANDPDGGTVEWLYANVFHIEDGKVTEVWGLADETSESDVLIDKLLD